MSEVPSFGSVRRVLIRPGDDLEPPLRLRRGFVEVREGDRTLIVLRPGALLALEQLPIPSVGHVLAPARFLYIGTTDVRVESFEGRGAEELLARQATHEQVIAWLGVFSEDRDERMLAALAHLAYPGGQLVICISALARVCRVGRTYLYEILDRLEQAGQLKRTGRTIHLPAANAQAMSRPLTQV